MTITHGPSPEPTNACLVHGGQWTKSQALRRAPPHLRSRARIRRRRRGSPPGRARRGICPADRGQNLMRKPSSVHSWPRSRCPARASLRIHDTSRALSTNQPRPGDEPGIVFVRCASGTESAMSLERASERSSWWCAGHGNPNTTRPTAPDAAKGVVVDRPRRGARRASRRPRSHSERARAHRTESSTSTSCSCPTRPGGFRRRRPSARLRCTPARHEREPGVQGHDHTRYRTVRKRVPEARALPRATSTRAAARSTRRSTLASSRWGEPRSADGSPGYPRRRSSGWD